MQYRLTGALALCFLSLSSPLWSQTTPTTVRFKTTLGDIDVNLLPGSAPRTVANFLNYVRRGDYNNSFFHRSVANFIIQGGGYRWANNDAQEIPQDPPVINEYRESNLRGTLAMAKLGDDPNSATNQWFFNTNNNAANLNNQNGGFTVFGRVANSASLAVMDRIAAVTVPNPPVLDSPFDQIPLINYSGGQITQANLVMVESITEVEAPVGSTPTIAEGGIITASGFGASPVIAPGTYIEIYGSGLAGEVSRAWATRDFVAGNAPTSLEGISVTIGGRNAFVNYVSPALVNVQVPASTPLGAAIPVVVSNRGQASAPVNVEVRALSPGLLAPPNFKNGERQFAVAVRATNGALISYGPSTGVPALAATRGETLILFGIGFGPVTPSSVAITGRIVQETARINAAVTCKIGGIDAEVGYAGLAPGSVGLYQFNITVPADAPTGDQPLELTVNGEPLQQRLFLPIQ
jgi:uncharacterized protein (TIGR03437 family)